MKKLLVLAVSLSVLTLGLPAHVSGAVKAAEPLADAVPGLTPAPRDALTRALEAGGITEAEYSLERARSLFEPEAVARRFGEIATPDAREATLVLRDLALRKHELSGEERAAADGMLSRPTDNRGGDPININYGGANSKRTCSANLCVHYVTTTTSKHQVDATDDDANGLPDYVDSVLTVMQQQVWHDEIKRFGFRRPRGDLASHNNGGNRKIDFYLAQLGTEGLYGYCTSDDPNLGRAIKGTYRFSDMSAYCVLDNDYRPAEYPEQTPLKNLRVTGAHEFFHAVQFAYDFFEDLWILESTATWIEDEVFDGINDNLQFLKTSAMRTPRVPLDYGDPSTGIPYGNFVFWRYARERFRRKVVRQVWNQADGARGGPDLYSLKATRKVLDRKSSFGKVFSKFALANFLPGRFYSEGASYRTATGGGAPVSDSFTLGKFHRRTAWVSRRLDHLASSYLMFKRGKGVGPDTRIKVNVDGPGLKSKPKALLIALDGSQVVRKKLVRLDGKGVGSDRVPFGKVTRVLLVLSNASTRFRDCFTDFRSPFSCAGHPVDQNKSFRFSASLIN
ncbi:MAG: MXAN_6640 family putative metalloprotease [Actinomycetota bacterium]